ncbi:Rossmann-fold NAD(P)-binding domain-containing protein [Pontibacter flavimaris]|uniref:SDR family NAD(P)-dependent oxidoreductase n=1 Tax=Pontibacter flavimaris TaxID=1797110 RepID=UPI0011150C17
MTIDGAAGIDLETVKAFTATGATVFVCDVNEEALEELKRQVPGVLTYTCDISSDPVYLNRTEAPACLQIPFIAVAQWIC